MSDRPLVQPQEHVRLIPARVAHRIGPIGRRATARGAARRLQPLRRLPPVRTSAGIDVGRTLRRERGRRRISLAQAAEETKIRRTYLEALEANRGADAYPAPLYARAFLVEYARYLQADPRPLLAAFAPGTDVEDAGPALPPRPRAPFVVPSWAMLATALTLLVVGLAVAGGRLPDGAFAHAARTITSTGPRAPSAPARVLAEHTVAPVTSFTVVISVAGAPCWLRVTVDGTPALERTVLPGQTQTFASRHEIDLLVGNASAVGLMVNGQVLPSLGNAGQVRALRILLVDGAVRVEPGAA